MSAFGGLGGVIAAQLADVWIYKFPLAATHRILHLFLPNPSVGELTQETNPGEVLSNHGEMLIYSLS